MSLEMISGEWPRRGELVISLELISRMWPRKGELILLELILYEWDEEEKACKIIGDDIIRMGRGRESL